MEGHVMIAVELINQGIDVNQRDCDGFTALIYASASGHTILIQMLIESNADPNAMTNAGKTALMTALEYKHYDAAELLIEKNADINAYSPGMVKSNREEKSHLLPVLQSNSTIFVGVSKTALITAIISGDLKAVELLLKYYPNKDICDDRTGWSAIVFAARQGHRDILQKLLDGTLYSEIAVPQLETALVAACEGKPRIIQYPIEWPAEL
jgi:serine/threonine-protein phosphatase 6 regulatory ankyrin repeat subunit B